MRGCTIDLSLQASTDDTSSIKQFKEKVRSEIRSRWFLNNLNTTSLDVLASALDPRFRQLKILNDEQRQSVKEEITCRMAAFSLASHDRDNTTTTNQPSALDILLGPDEVIAELPTFQKEVDAYFAEKVVSREVNPLVWWKDNNVHFPNLAKVAKSLLCIPATSAAAERIFSTAGLTVNKLRFSLNPDTVDALIFLNKNHSVLNIE